MIATKNFPRSPIELHAPGGTAFQAVAHSIVAGSNKSPLAGETREALMTCGVIATNRSSLPVHALSVLFDYKDKRGFHKHESVLLYNLDDNPKSAIFLPTESRFLALPSKTTYIYSSLGRSAGVLIGNNVSVETWCSSLENLSVSIDAVVFSDGSIAGPDAERVAEKLNAQMDAITDICSYVAQHAGDGSSAHLISTLQSYAAGKPTLKEMPEDRKYYLEVRKTYAQLLLGEANSSRDAIVANAKNILAARHIPRIHRRDP